MSKKIRPTRDLEGLKWLVKSRSQNQSSAVELYRIYQEYKEILVDNIILRSVAQNLLGVNFSLWRAVFLTDVDRQQGMMMADAESFLKNLIENNTVAYQQDKNANYWTFRYYVSNARNILRRMKTNSEEYNIVKYITEEERGMDAHDWWAIHQSMLDNAIINLEKALKAAEAMEDRETEDGDDSN